jgi:glycosyltransferase involved in cell wall biosynthesis
MTRATSDSARARADDASASALPQIVHVMPYDGIGGVEIAASSVEPGRYPGFVFRKVFVSSQTRIEPRPYVYEPGLGPENNPRAFLRTIAHLLRAKPDALILSLWRSCIVGLAIKMLRPRTRLVVFLHNTRHSNLVDGVLTRATAWIADAIWADSASTAAQRLGSRWIAATRPISFLTTRLARVVRDTPAPQFITWGRLHPRKRIEWAIEFFALIHARHPGAGLVIIGPDRGEGPMLKAKAAQLGLEHAVRFVGPADLAQIAEHAAGSAFFVQTSRAEGMGMATVEAMQFGLVPVVTPVGEIGKYVEDGRNGIWFRDPSDACDKVERLLADSAAFQAMSEAARQTWCDRPLYRDEFLSACGDIAARVQRARR